MYKIFLILLCCFISLFSDEVTISGKMYAKVPFKPSFTVVVSQRGKTDATINTNQGGSLPQWSFKSDWPTSCWPSDPLPNDTFSWGKVSASREGYIITPAIRYYSVSIEQNMSGQDFNAVDTMDPVIQVDSPAAGEIIILNSPDPTGYGRITWCGVDNSRSCMRRDYYVSYNNGRNYTLIKTMNTDLPCPGINLHYERVKHVFDTVSDSCLVKIVVTDYDSNTGMDCSGIFRVVDTVRPTITVTSPNGGEKWYTGQTHNITWVASDNVTLKSRSIYYSSNNGANWILIDSSGNAGFTLPWILSCTPSKQYKIKIKVFDQSGNSQEDVSDSVFEIIDPVSIKPCTMPVKFGVLVMREVIQIGMEKAGKVSISLYDLKGRRVWVREEVLSVGYHRINKRPMALGLYILRVVRADKSLRIKYVEVY